MTRNLLILLSAGLIVATVIPAAAQVRASAGQVHVGVQNSLRQFPLRTTEAMKSDCLLQRIKTRRGTFITKRICDPAAE